MSGIDDLRAENQSLRAERDKLREACNAALSRGCANLGQLADHDDTIRLLRAAIWPKGVVAPSRVAPGEPDPRD